jgi:hypothetical protein
LFYVTKQDVRVLVTQAISGQHPLFEQISSVCVNEYEGPILNVYKATVYEDRIKRLAVSLASLHHDELQVQLCHTLS